VNKLLIVSNDAGGAEVLSAWGEFHQNQFDISYWLTGPAASIFSRKISKLNFYEHGLDKLGTFDQIITSTSWSTLHEKQVIQKAKHLKIPVAVYLDNWMGYAQRFELNNELVLPDEIWVGDEYAKHLADLVFPNLRIILVPNLYMQGLITEIENLQHEERSIHPRILYVTEPTSVVALSKYGQENYFGYTEFTALNNFLAYIQHQSIQYEKIRIRPHPSECADKYSRYLQDAHHVIEISNTNALAEDCAWADIVAGCQSMVMAIAVNAGKQVISCLPPGVESYLPYPQIVKIFQS